MFYAKQMLYTICTSHIIPDMCFLIVLIEEQKKILSFGNDSISTLVKQICLFNYKNELTAICKWSIRGRIVNLNYRKMGLIPMNCYFFYICSFFLPY